MFREKAFSVLVHLVVFSLPLKIVVVVVVVIVLLRRVLLGGLGKVDDLASSPPAEHVVEVDLLHVVVVLSLGLTYNAEAVVRNLNKGIFFPPPREGL